MKLSNNLDSVPFRFHSGSQVPFSSQLFQKNFFLNTRIDRLLFADMPFRLFFLPPVFFIPSPSSSSHLTSHWISSQWTWSHCERQYSILTRRNKNLYSLCIITFWKFLLSYWLTHITHSHDSLTFDYYCLTCI